MPVIAFAAFVVVANHAHLAHNVGQSVLEPMKRRRQRLRQSQTTYSANPPFSSATRRRKSSTAFMMAIMPTH
jgi:NADH:ubiquinone oxidoreductase subunit 3 (subunit A)